MATFIIDPVCIHDSGHNLTAAKRYGHMARKISKDKAVLLVSRLLNENLTNSEDSEIYFDCFFSHYYPDFIPIKGAEKFLNKRGELKLDIGALAAKELNQFFDKYSPNQRDTLFYPSIDYFSLISLIDFLDKTSSTDLPKIIIRFIGVMEYDHYKTGISLENILEKIRKLINTKGLNIKFSAESSIMANHIENIINQKVEITPTLVSNNALKHIESDVFTIIFPGSARRDKGFDRISSILNNFERINSEKKYRAIIQLLPPSELKHFGNHALELVKNGKVTLLPCSLDESEIINLFQISDIVVAPYDRKVYKYRSSAIMAESAIYCRPIVASSHCGFSDQIEKYKLGFLAESDADFAEKIEIFRSMPITVRRAYAQKARENFLRFSQNAYTSLFH